MNKNIEELAKQAGMVKYPTGLGTPPENTIWGDRNIEKFAELIMQECVNKMWITGTDYHVKVMQEMKEHFRGVL